MNKILLSLSLVMGTLVSAQINKGTVYLSGQVSYTHQKNNEVNSSASELFVMPSAGVFIAPNLAVGAGIGFSGNQYKIDHSFSNDIFLHHFEAENTYSSFFIAPFVRKYFNLSENLYFFGQLEVPLQFGTSELKSSSSVSTYDGLLGAESRNEKENLTSIGVNIKPGLDYFITKNWSVEATLGEFGYINHKIKDSDAGTNVYRFGVDLSAVTIGVKYVFAK